MKKLIISILVLFATQVNAFERQKVDCLISIVIDNEKTGGRVHVPIYVPCYFLGKDANLVSLHCGETIMIMGLDTKLNPALRYLDENACGTNGFKELNPKIINKVFYPEYK